MANQKIPTREEILRSTLFTLCDTEEHLHIWIKTFLGLDIPNAIVCADDIRNPPSDSCPMSLIWEMYSKARVGDDNKYIEFLGYAARDSFKTLSAAIMETLCLFHLNRDVAHMAAIESQARNCQKYVENFLKRPILREFLTSKNKREIEITKYLSDDEQILSPIQWEKLDELKKLDYQEEKNSIKIVICTVEAANGFHCPFVVVDECIDGLTNILIKNKRIGDFRGSGALYSRDRATAQANGIFNRLMGLYPTVEGKVSCQITEPKENIEALSYNFDIGNWEFKPILAAKKTWKKRLQLTLENGKKLICTENHPILTLNGYIKANSLNINDKIVNINNKAKSITKHNTVIVKDGFRVNYKTPDIVDDWEQVILGSLLGDGGVYKRGSSNAYFSEQHSFAQKDYLDFKANILNHKIKMKPKRGIRSGYTNKPLYGLYSANSICLNKYSNFKKDFIDLEKIEALALAIWYMDDGCSGNQLRISSESFTYEQHLVLQTILKSKFDLDIVIDEVHKNNKIYFCLRGGILEKRKLYEICKDYIHPTMQYKFSLLRNKRKCNVCSNEFFFYNNGTGAVTCGNLLCNNIQEGTFKLTKIIDKIELMEDWVYDFTIKDNHNFVANGVLVHNCDLTDPAAFEEAKMIPSGTRDGKLAMTFYTSTRKYSFGLVQKEIDNAQKSNLAVRHWNVIDVTQACPSSRYLPDRPKQKLYYSESKLVTLSESDWLLLSEKEKEQYDMKEGHEGCLTNCKLFAQCKGRLIDKQTSKSTLLKSIDHVQSLFGKVSLESAKAQLMCWKPSSEGLIFPNFSRENHMISANKMAEKITGEKYIDNFSKSQLIDLMKSLGASFYCGMDHGFTHHFAVVTGALIGHILYIIDVISVPRLELQQKVDLCKEKIKPFNPVIYPDNAYPSDNATFRRNGFRLVDFKKDVLAGIESIRLRLAPGGDRTVSMFLLKDDPGCELLASKFLQYHWKVDAAGKLTDEPDKNDDDEIDSIRYLCQNTPLNKTGVIVAPDMVRASSILVNPNNQWMHNTIRDLTKDSEGESSVQGKEGGLLFTI